MKDKVIKKVVVTPKKVTIHYKECQNSPIVNVIERDIPMTPEQQSHFGACVNSMIQDALEILEEDKRQEEIDYPEEPEPDEELDGIEDESEPEGEEPEGTTEPTVVEDSPEPEPEPEQGEPEPTPEVVEPPKKKRGRPKKNAESTPEPKVETPEKRETGLRPPAPKQEEKPNVVTVPEEGITGEPDGMASEPSPEEDATDWSKVKLPVFENSEIPEFKNMEKGHLIWYVNNNDKDTLIEDVKWNFNKSMNPDSNLQNIRVQALEIAFDELKIAH